MLIYYQLYKFSTGRLLWKLGLILAFCILGQALHSVCVSLLSSFNFNSYNTVFHEMLCREFIFGAPVYSICNCFHITPLLVTLSFIFPTFSPYQSCFLVP